MKKFFALLFVLSLLLAPTAFAMSCETSQAYGGSDACWTEVLLNTNAVTIGSQVSVGTVLVYDYQSGLTTYADGTLPQAGSVYVRPATVSLDSARVAGVLQTSIDTTKLGNPVKVLVRGYGNIKAGGSITSGDPLYVRVAAGQTTGSVGSLDFTSSNVVSGYSNIAFALQTTTTDGVRKAYIKIV